MTPGRNDPTPAYVPGMREAHPHFCWKLVAPKRCCILDRGHDNGLHEHQHDPPVVLVRDGTIVGPEGTEIDFRTLDYSVWLTIKAKSDVSAERLASALEAAFPEEPTDG